MTFSERLRLIRTTRGVTQKTTAKAINTTEQNYQRYERGTQQPTLPVLVDLANYFDVSLDYLVGRSDTIKEAPQEAGLDIFSDEELAIIVAFRNITPESKAYVLFLLEALKTAEASNIDVLHYSIAGKDVG